jgi:methanogenic corrinoid protein MtbC1
VQERARQFVTYLLEGDQIGAEAVVCRGLCADASPVDMFQDVIAPALALVGTMWERAELSIADEHMATEITNAVVHRLLVPRRRDRGPVAIVTAAPQELHGLGARSLTSVLAHQGWQAVYLGPQTPAAAVELFAEARRPQLVAVSVKLAHHVSEAVAMIARIKAQSDPPKVILGGAAVSGLRYVVAGADCVTDDLRTALAWADGVRTGRPAALSLSGSEPGGSATTAS